MEQSEFQIGDDVYVIRASSELVNKTCGSCGHTRAKHLYRYDVHKGQVVGVFSMQTVAATTYSYDVSHNIGRTIGTVQSFKGDRIHRRKSDAERAAKEQETKRNSRRLND